jgi:ribokinase
MTVIVFGSINKDLVATAPRLPLPGETLLGRDFFTAPGGKGANQAVAVARLGINTYMVGRVGAHSFGAELIQGLQIAGVKTENIFIDETISSGVAIITVDDAGENEIVVIPGANGKVNEDDVNRLTKILPGSEVLLLQFEVPMTAVLEAAKSAKKLGVKVILDPAPVQFDVPDELYPLIDIITPNEVEAAQLVGFAVDSQQSAKLAAAVLLQKGVKNAIVKLGAKGVVCANNDDTFFVPAFPIDAVDTVAAGDAFNGGLAAGLASGLSLRDCIVWGAAAGAIAATTPGAQPSLPDRFTFDLFLKQRS